MGSKHYHLEQEALANYLISLSLVIFTYKLRKTVAPDS